MPVWHELTTEARNSGTLVVLGVIQEQHPDRCRLFAQWKGFEWPILHDPINLLKPQAVPIFVAIDEAGIVVDANLQTSELPDFLARKSNPATSEVVARVLHTAQSLEAKARLSNSAGDWLSAGDHRILWGDQQQLTAAVDSYSKAVELNPKDAGAMFRLGVAVRMRYDSPSAKSDDFQSAVDAWGRALDLDPNHYIYRRRIQQYGPRLIKPYPFYDWVDQARNEITQRGDTPIRLAVEPGGAEIAQPAKTFEEVASVRDQPDRDGRITRDFEKFIDASVVVVPGTVSRGESLRVHLHFRPNRTAHWNNETEPLRVWIDVPDGWKADSSQLEATQPPEPESRETRNLEFELRSPSETTIGAVKAYALYYVCDDVGGQCLYRRYDLTIPIRFRD